MKPFRSRAKNVVLVPLVNQKSQGNLARIAAFGTVRRTISQCLADGYVSVFVASRCWLTKKCVCLNIFCFCTIVMLTKLSRVTT